MRTYDYTLVNVFANSHFGGNPLAVFYAAEGLNNDEMQLIARQFNLSEVVFIQESTSKQAVKKLKIFTPDYEMPFAGHPTIGAAFVLHSQFNFPSEYLLQTNAGLVEIQHQQDITTFALKNEVTIQNAPLSIEECAEILGLKPSDIASQPYWVNTGVEQLLVELSSEQAVKNCKINTNLSTEKIFLKDSVYVWYRKDDKVKARLFFQSRGGIVEDPGTGSAAANLGGWHIAHQLVPFTCIIFQGDEIQKPSQLFLRVDEQKNIFVGGKVIQVGKGEFYIP